VRKLFEEPLYVRVGINLLSMYVSVYARRYVCRPMDVLYSLATAWLHWYLMIIMSLSLQMAAFESHCVNSHSNPPE